MSPLKTHKPRQLAPFEADIAAAARLVDRVGGGQAGVEQFAEPAFGIIVEANEARTSSAERCMVEKGEMMKTELRRRVPQERTKLRQIGAGRRRFRERIAKPPHGAARPGIGSPPPVTLHSPGWIRRFEMFGE